MGKRLYVAYGSNLNFEQMKHRCSTAKMYGTGVIEGYELQFKGSPTNAFATIEPKIGESVPVAVWEISPRDEKALDCYEGYPSHYFKQDVKVKLENEEVDAMVYIMNPKMTFGMPSQMYYQIVHEGYNDCDLNTDVLLKAVTKSSEMFYSAAVQPININDYLESDDIEEDEFNYDEQEESDPSYSGMQM